uniref:Uncharacterized protein n=1 Tax=Nelumbo nucifera TaxID=4432 RepID=A0A822Y211_NELNU|nr:TPA_asm: hypothetical protein HUJ06_027471 [Nelumbo nucifera]
MHTMNESTAPHIETFIVSETASLKNILTMVQPNILHGLGADYLDTIDLQPIPSIFKHQGRDKDSKCNSYDSCPSFILWKIEGKNVFYWFQNQENDRSLQENLVENNNIPKTNVSKGAGGMYHVNC